jgi:predicted nucleic acid-binding protein
MKRVIVLDSGPLGLLTQRPGVPAADACREWASRCLGAGEKLVVPAIVNYELRRELLRAGKGPGLARLERFIARVPDRYLPLTDAALQRAAELWAESRRRGRPTADPKKLDIDVILVAQALSLDLASEELVVATMDVGDLSRFLDARLWTEIDPSTEG